MTTQDWIAMKQKQKQYLEARRVRYAMVSLLAPKCVLLMLEFHEHSTFVVKKILIFRASRFFQFFQTNKQKMKPGI